MITHEIIRENAQEIAKVYQEAVNTLDKKQISTSYDIAFRRYADKIQELSAGYCILNRYLSDANIESGKYKISLTFQYSTDKVEVEMYLNAINDE